jgi:flagellar basal-body rod modification protein FlgD
MAINPLAGLNTDAINGTDPTPKKKPGEVGKTEFLQLLITQLKNQDPLEPMNNEQFAVNLAQFSQLEQLIGINDKLGSGSSDVSSLAGYLGKEVTLTDPDLQFTNGDGGLLKFDLRQDASSVKVDLLNADGSVKDVIDVGALHAGKQAIQLNGDPTENGKYGYRITALGQSGQFEVPGKAGGVVSGFVPGAHPVLIINGREVDPASIGEVGLPTAQGAQE